MKFWLVAAIVLGIIAQSQEVFGCWWFCSSSKKCFSRICSSNPSNDIRGWDRHGSGAWGASRGSRTHKGIDIECKAGSSVNAPFPAKVIRRSNPYWSNDKAYNTGIYLQGTGSWADYKVKMWYVTMDVSKGQRLSAGDFIGSMTDRTIDASGMTNHVHVQLEKNGRIVDPTSYAC